MRAHECKTHATTCHESCPVIVKRYEIAISFPITQTRTKAPRSVTGKRQLGRVKWYQRPEIRTQPPSEARINMVNIWCMIRLSKPSTLIPSKTHANAWACVSAKHKQVACHALSVCTQVALISINDKSWIYSCYKCSMYATSVVMRYKTVRKVSPREGEMICYTITLPLRGVQRGWGGFVVDAYLVEKVSQRNSRNRRWLVKLLTFL